MTIGIVAACKDGIVIGADRKVVRARGQRIKALEDKIFQTTFQDGRNILICSSGGTDIAKRAMREINPNIHDDISDCSSFRDMIESKISYLAYNLRQRGIEYDATLLFGTLDIDDTPTIGHITPFGLTETANDGYYTCGIAASYAELVLQDSYEPGIRVADARIIIGGLIERIGKVDNDVEGMDVFSISCKNKVEALTWAERQGIMQVPLSFNFRKELDNLKREIQNWEKFAEMQEEFRKTREKKEKPKSKKNK